MGRRDIQVFSSTALVAALGSVTSSWIDIGKRAPYLEVLRTNTGGTYAFEVDWSHDGGVTTASTETVTTTAGTTTRVSGKARWVRVRIRNTHATVAFSAHSTVVNKDGGSGQY